MRETVVFNRQGVTKAFLLDGTFYDYEGQPLAFLFENGPTIFSYLGKHLGWFKNKYVWDLRGDAVGFAAGALRGPLIPSETREPPRLPVSLGTLPPGIVRSAVEEYPVLSFAWSQDTLEHFFGIGKAR